MNGIVRVQLRKCAVRESASDIDGVGSCRPLAVRCWIDPMGDTRHRRRSHYCVARTMEGRVGLSLLRVHELSSGLRSGRRLDKRKAERTARALLGLPQRLCGPTKHSECGAEHKPVSIAWPSVTLGLGLGLGRSSCGSVEGTSWSGTACVCSSTEWPSPREMARALVLLLQAHHGGRV